MEKERQRKDLLSLEADIYISFELFLTKLTSKSSQFRLKGEGFLAITMAK